MVVTKELINARLEILNQDLQATVNQHNVLRGAIADCEYWLKQMDIQDEQVLETSGQVRQA